jgi:D-alanyl-D-alanine carboxypeptidase/D-alanyl-D-alanine-endopeptidase (penicillin-binding protein 4)
MQLFQLMTSKLKFLKVCLLLSSATFCLAACSVNQRMARKVNRLFNGSEIVDQYHVGFALYDPAKQQMIYGKNADTYFTPASNTKLFTFYAGLKMIPDSIPSLRYVKQGDSLIFWGTGDPSFLQTELKGTKAFDFLKNSGKELFFAPGRYSGTFYGQGWAWDDYNDYYQAEITELPLMDNLLAVSADRNRLSISPLALSNCVMLDSAADGGDFNVQRAFDQNSFSYPNVAIPADYHQQIPYKTSTILTLNILADTLKKPIGLIHMQMPATAKTIYNMKSDSVFKAMLLPSDNFIAEQLLLVYSNQISADLSSTNAITYIRQKYLSNLPGKPAWVDGSGLSRGNLFTPRDIVSVLDSIYVTVRDNKKLFSMLPAGGKSGTLKNAYPKTDHPFVFGKTGSLSNNHNQSGYVVSKKGKVYIYSFMNNNFVLPSSAVRAEMARIITYIHEQF